MPLDSAAAAPPSPADENALAPCSAAWSPPEAVGPAVAHITARRAAGRPGGQGSGVLFTPDGYALTNSHVMEGAASLRVSLIDSRELPVELAGRNADTDIACSAPAAPAGTRTRGSAPPRGSGSGRWWWPSTTPSASNAR